MNAYALSYALGYFYGRSRPYFFDNGNTVPEQDRALSNNTGFKFGFEAGFRDFQDIDLLAEALSTEEVDK